MLADIQCGNNIELDQVCLYHLVKFRGLATEWARDPEWIAALPSNEKASANWEAIRTTAIAMGYHPTTLTNFEKSCFQGDSRGYIYEVRSFDADRYNMIAFGPAGISYLSSDPSRTGLKTINPESSLEYLQSVGTQSLGGNGWAKKWLGRKMKSKNQRRTMHVFRSN